jgi:tetratricopeptide (TPR) repeat protein
MGRLSLAFALSVALAVPCAGSDIPTPDEVLSQGQCWSEAGQSWDDQVKACGDIIDPRLFASPSGRAQALYNRGWAHVFLCEYDRAISDFGLALRIVPDAATIRDGLAVAARRKNLYANAERDILAALSAAVTDTLPDGTADPRLQLMQSALVDLREAVALEPRASAIHARLADGLLLAGQYRAALDEFAQAIELDDRNDRLLLGVAEARLALGDPQGAWDDAMEALRRMSSCSCGSRLLARLAIHKAPLPRVRRHETRAASFKSSSDRQKMGPGSDIPARYHARRPLDHQR